MALAAAYAVPFRASIWPVTLKRTTTARSAYAAAAPAESPVTPSRDGPFGVASNWAVKAPVCVVNALLSHAGELVVQPGGGAAGTVTLALPLCPSLVAVIVAVPATFAVTRPLALTDAAVVLSLDHVIVRPDSGVPLASCGVALSCTV